MQLAEFAAALMGERSPSTLDRTDPLLGLNQGTWCALPDRRLADKLKTVGFAHERRVLGCVALAFSRQALR